MENVYVYEVFYATWFDQKYYDSHFAWESLGAYTTRAKAFKKIQTKSPDVRSSKTGGKNSYVSENDKTDYVIRVIKIIE